jgi:hypothetical protein
MMIIRAALGAALALGLIAAPLAAKAQPAAKIWRIGTLHTSPSSDEADRVAALKRGSSLKTVPALEALRLRNRKPPL